MKHEKSKPFFVERSHEGGEGHLLREIMRTQQAVLAVFSREVGMPTARLSLMRILAIAWPKRLGVMEIARHLGINAAAVTRQLGEMEAEHLLDRHENLKDKRRVAVTLSAKGRKVFEELHKRGHDLEQSLVAAISPDEVKIAVKVLSAVRGTLEMMR